MRGPDEAGFREAKAELGVGDELGLTPNAVAVLRERYLLRDDDGRVIESTGEMMERVARHVAVAEDRFAPGASRRWEEGFAAALKSLAFLPNSPTLMNAGTEMGLLSGCFVFPVEDSLDSIFATLRQMALIHQAGDGTGFSFSRLRCRGDRVRTTHGTASGPVSFMRLRVLRGLRGHRLRVLSSGAGRARGCPDPYTSSTTRARQVPSSFCSSSPL